MRCIHCNSTQVADLNDKTAHGYCQWRCCRCRKQFNERTGTPFNRVSYRTEIVVLVVYYRLRFKLSLDDVVEIMTTRNIEISHQTVQNRYSGLVRCSATSYEGFVETPTVKNGMWTTPR